MQTFILEYIENGFCYKQLTSGTDVLDIINRYGHLEKLVIDGVKFYD